MLPMIAKYTLMLTSIYFIVPFMLVGFFFVNRRYFSEALMLFMVAVVVNTYLKFLFKIELPAGINAHTYAFPSGHMTLAIVSLGWLAMRMNKKWMNALSFILIVAIGFSLVFKGYHNWVDIAGSAMLGVLLIFFGTITLASSKDETLPLVGVGFGVIAIVLMTFLPKSQSHLWMSPGVLLSASLVLWLQNKDGGSLSSIFSKTDAVVTALVGAIIINFAFPYLKSFLRPEALVFTKYALITFWSLYVSDALVKRST